MSTASVFVTPVLGTTILDEIKPPLSTSKGQVNVRCAAGLLPTYTRFFDILKMEKPTFSFDD